MHSQFKDLDRELINHVTMGIKALALQRPVMQLDFLSEFFEHRADCLERSADRIDELAAMKEVDCEIERAIALERLRVLSDLINKKCDLSTDVLLSKFAEAVNGALPGSNVHSFVLGEGNSSEELLSQLANEIGAQGLPISASPETMGRILEEDCDLVHLERQVLEENEESRPGGLLLMKLIGPAKVINMLVVDMEKIKPGIYNENLESILCQTIGRISQITSSLSSWIRFKLCY